MRSKTVSILLCSFGMALATSAAAQSSQERIDAIWAIATNRMIAQQNAWFEDGDFLACISVLGLEAKKWPKDYEIWTNLGWMQENVEEWDDALTTYDSYRKLNPQEPDNSLPEAQFYYMRKQYAKVPSLLESAIKRPCHPNNYRILAWSYERMKKYSDAVRVWKVYLGTGANDAVAKRNLARDEQRAQNTS
jgi:tetratricopeptide (TPR) repeat protein